MDNCNMKRTFRDISNESQMMEVVPTTPPSPPPSSAFLPSFLLGESEVSEEQRSRVGGRDDSLASPLGCKTFSPVKADYNRGTKLRLNGPPIQSLFDEAESPPRLNNSSVMSPPWLSNSMSVRSNDNSTRDDDLWVVVFGFTPAAASHVLNIFNQCGRVVEHMYPPAGGNWMLIRYEDRSGVRKALGFNTRVVAGNIMLGVTERRRVPELRISEADKENNTTANNSSMLLSPHQSRVRHLGPPKQLPPQSPAEENVPKKDTSVMSRAMDLIFGW